MSSDFRHLRQIGNRIRITMLEDPEGYLGRECPSRDCEGYFKITPGTGLSGDDLECICPYCGHSASQDHFWTKEQLEYARSVALRRVTEAVRKDLKSLEFEIKPRGPFGIGMSMKLKPGRPIPLRHYREKTLETVVLCVRCSLQYAVYGVFAFCPDCGIHNSEQILDKNLDLVRKQLTLAAEQDDEELRRHLVQDALENCVSVFDGFGRECCRIRASRSSDPSKCGNVSFQNLPGAATNLNTLFGFDLEAAIAPDDWEQAKLGFLRRHLVAHRAGVIDAKYLAAAGESRSLLGRRISITSESVEKLAAVVGDLGTALVNGLPQPR